MDLKKLKIIVSISSSGDLIFTAVEEIDDGDGLGHDKKFVVTYSNPCVDTLEDLKFYFNDFIDELKDFKDKKVEIIDGPVYEIF